MKTFFLIGKYSMESMKDIGADRTDNAINLIKELGGEVISMYGLLGMYDCALIVNLESVEKAMKASLGLSLLTGISFTTLPAVPVEDFDRLMA